MPTLQKRFTLLLVLFYTFGFSQEILGIVIDSTSREPLEGASVYFDNTTIGTSTNSKGEFKIKFQREIKASLIISFIGYKTLIINYYTTADSLEIRLDKSSTVLNEVTLASKNDWPRKLKLEEFRKNYLGETSNGLASKILNEDDLILKYSKKDKQLSAYSKVPLRIKNVNLAYLIIVNLKHFEVNYTYVSLRRKILNIKDVYYLGNNFYQSLEKNPTKKTLKKRKETYLGSPLHFMRSLANEDLEREQYKIYRGDHPVSSKKYINVRPIDNLNNVKVVFEDKLNILYEGSKQSYIKITVPEFYIDNFGNYSPFEAIRFGGELGKQRIGDALPLDYLIFNKVKD